MKRIELRAAQQDAYNQLKSADFGILSAPTGWGKSVTLCSIVGRDKRVVIAIPQKIISKGFVGTLNLTLPTGKTLDYKVTHNLCEPTLGKMAMLKLWLLSSNPGVVVTTHQALAQLWAELDDNEKQQAANDITFVIDEAHHIHTSDAGYNQLGSLVRYVLEQTDSTRLILATAYFFRGDCLPVIDEKHLGRFAKYYVPFDEFWRTLKHIKSYRYDFVPYKGTVWKDVEKLLSVSNEPTLIYCPWAGHKLLTQNKSKFVERLVKILGKTTGATLWTGGIEDNVIIDLTDDTYRNEKVRYIIDHGDSVRAILAVGMMKEGADWTQCARVVDLVPSSSNQDRMQRFGRLVRDFPGKKTISYFSFLPHITDGTKEQQREQLTRLYAHFHASLVLENALAPIAVMQHSETGKRGERDGRPVELLGDYDEQSQENILHDTHEALINLAATGPVDSTAAKHAVETVLDSYGIKRDKDAMARQIVLMFRRAANYTLPVAELVDAGFDKIWSQEVFDGLVMFSGGVGGPTNFLEIRAAIGSVFDSRWVENFERVSQLPSPPTPEHRAHDWCATNRRIHSQGKLSGEKVKLLETISWWYWRKPLVDRWDSMIETLKQMKTSPKKGTNPLEYSFVRKQCWNYANGKLHKAKAKQLESISWWQWDTESDKTEAKITALRAAYPPERGSTEWNSLCHFRRYKKQGKLPQDKVKALESIPGFHWGR